MSSRVTTSTASATPTAATTATSSAMTSHVNQLIVVLIRNLRAPCFPSILELIDDTFTESTEFSKSSLEMRHQECFAVKTGRNGLLDVARKTFLQSVEDIHQAAEEYFSDLGVPASESYQ